MAIGHSVLALVVTAALMTAGCSHQDACKQKTGDGLCADPLPRNSTGTPR